MDWKKFRKKGKRILQQKRNVKSDQDLQSATVGNCGEKIRLYSVELHDPDKRDKLMTLLREVKLETVIINNCFKEACYTSNVLQALNTNKRIKKLHLDLTDNEFSEECCKVLKAMISRGKLTLLVLPGRSMDPALCEDVFRTILSNCYKLETLNASDSVLTETSLKHLKSMIESKKVTKQLILRGCVIKNGSEITLDYEQKLKDALKTAKSSLHVLWFSTEDGGARYGMVEQVKVKETFHTPLDDFLPKHVKEAKRDVGKKALKTASRLIGNTHSNHNGRREKRVTERRERSSVFDSDEEIDNIHVEVRQFSCQPEANRWSRDDGDLQSDEGPSNHEDALPPSWDDMNGCLVKQVSLERGSEEYTNVLQKFQNAGLHPDNPTILRIQSVSLYKQYVAKKAEVTEKLRQTTHQIERELFHGTIHADKIVSNGFDRSFAGGANAALYGNGVYFATTASYSHRYTQPSGNIRTMFLASVITGAYTQGASGMKTPPERTPRCLYDSVVDSVQKPNMYIIFKDASAYPTYLLEYN